MSTKNTLFGSKETLQHVLNNCETMLDQGPLKEVSNQSRSFNSDLAPISPDIFPTQQRPNFVLINESSKSVFIIIELFLSSKTSTKLMSVSLTNTRSSPVICKNRVITPSSSVLRLVAGGHYC